MEIVFIFTLSTVVRTATVTTMRLLPTPSGPRLALVGLAILCASASPALAYIGPGIAVGDLEHIFEPFFTKKKLGRSGSGLGLAIAKQLTELMDGEIGLELTAD